jgi:CheY-like chemotaxis protein
MATVLVVDDSPVERSRAAGLLTRPPADEEHWQRNPLTVAEAGGGREALEAISRKVPDLVVTDLRMPEMNGLELVLAIKDRYPSVPVIVMTAYGSEDVALQALQSGAAGYVPKRRLATELLGEVWDVLATVQADRGHRQVLECQASLEAHFVLGNDGALVPHLVGHLRGLLADARLCGGNDLLRVGIALNEALVNAIHHGNLEVNSALREGSERDYSEHLAERRRQSPYRDRRVRLTVRQTPDQVRYLIRDEGPGFDPRQLPDPRDPANLERASGRGLLLIRTFMDEVRHNDSGNEITLVKRCGRPAGPSPAPPAGLSPALPA